MADVAPLNHALAENVAPSKKAARANFAFPKLACLTNDEFLNWADSENIASLKRTLPVKLAPSNEAWPVNFAWSKQTASKRHHSKLIGGIRCSVRSRSPVMTAPRSRTPLASGIPGYSPSRTCRSTSAGTARSSPHPAISPSRTSSWPMKRSHSSSRRTASRSISCGVGIARSCCIDARRVPATGRRTGSGSWLAQLTHSHLLLPNLAMTRTPQGFATKMRQSRSPLQRDNHEAARRGAADRHEI